MIPWQSLSMGEITLLSLSYIVLRAVIFYSLFSLLYRYMNKKRGIIKDLPTQKQLATERRANIEANIFEIIMLSTLLSSGLVKFHEASAENVISTFAFCYFFFEIWFYWVHRFLHTKAMMQVHITHHVSVITTPLSALTLSLREKTLNDFGMLLIPAALTRVFPFAIEGIILYHLYNFYINVMGHSNLELMPRWFAVSKLGQLFTTSTYHSIHHLKGKKNFGLFLTVFDRAFGTYDPQYLYLFKTVKDTGPFQRSLINSGVATI